MALENTDFERGKCGYKLIQYFGCSKPVIASPVGVNVDIVEPGKNGYLAADAADWKKYITLLLKDPQKRVELGQNGYQKVSRYFDVKVNFEALVSILEE